MSRARPGSRSADEEGGGQQDEAGGEEAERAVPARVVSAPARAGHNRMRRRVVPVIAHLRNDGWDRGLCAWDGARHLKYGASSVRPTAGASPRWGRGAVRPMGWGERSGGGRVEDRGLVPGGPCGRFIGHEAGWGGDGQPQDGAQCHPLIRAARTGGGGGGRPWNSTRAAGARTRPGTPRTGVGRLVRERGGRAAGDQVVKAVEIEQSVRLRRHRVVAAGPGGSRRTEAVGQEQHECPGPPPHQLLGTHEPHHDPNLAATRKLSRREVLNRGLDFPDWPIQDEWIADACSNNIHRCRRVFQYGRIRNRATPPVSTEALGSQADKDQRPFVGTGSGLGCLPPLARRIEKTVRLWLGS